MEEVYETTKLSVLSHVQAVFHELEEEALISHQEKYALLEDAFENASDVDELRVAFEQWYADHSSDVEFEHNPDEMWEHAVAGSEDDDEDEDEDEEEEDT